MRKPRSTGTSKVLGGTADKENIVRSCLEAMVYGECDIVRLAWHYNDTRNYAALKITHPLIWYLKNKNSKDCCEYLILVDRYIFEIQVDCGRIINQKVIATLSPLAVRKEVFKRNTRLYKILHKMWNIRKAT